MDLSYIAATVGSTIILSCRSPTSTEVIQAEWDFHGVNTDRPTLLYDGFSVNPQLDEKYDVLLNSSSSICDLHIHRLQQTDAGEYHCYLKTNDRTLKFVYIVTVNGTY